MKNFEAAISGGQDKHLTPGLYFLSNEMQKHLIVLTKPYNIYIIDSKSIN